MGNWEADVLSKEQLQYAATDAFASWLLYQVIKITLSLSVQDFHCRTADEMFPFLLLQALKGVHVWIHGSGGSDLDIIHQAPKYNQIFDSQTRIRPLNSSKPSVGLKFKSRGSGLAGGSSF